MINKQLLEELCDVQGVAGYEELAQEISIRELKSCCDEVYRFVSCIVRTMTSVVSWSAKSRTKGISACAA